jgi:lysophospholipase L1-like esterase
MLLIPVIIILIVLYVWYKQFEKSFFNKPKNYPDISKINKENKPIFIGFGDSLTQANMGADWLKILEAKNHNYQFFNAGMNADLTYTLLHRIDDVIDCQPQIISLLIGTNDISATIGQGRIDRYIELNKITTEIPNFEDFNVNIENIIGQLKEKTNAQIMVISLPPITEDLSHWINIAADKYSETLKEIAQKEGLIYIPFRETIKKLLPEKASQIVNLDETVKLIQMAGIQKYVLGRSWNDISKNRHAMFLTDSLHLNDDAAAILANLVDHEIQKISNTNI